MNIKNLLNNYSKKLHFLPNHIAKLDSEILLSKIIKKDRKYLILNPQQEINDQNIKLFNCLIERRKNGEPIAYIVENKEFWKNNFYINNDVLIPRPDTEILVEETLKLYKPNYKLKVLEVGVGSGCILLSILKERKNFSGVGIDVSKKAINVASFNAKTHHLENRTMFYKSDVDKFLIGKYDLILSNPPYIKKFDLKYLDKGITHFEPRLALDGGCDGFSKITKVINKASYLIKKKGKLILEIGCYQRNEIVKKLKNKKFYINKIIKDYAKNDRCITSTKI